MIYWFAPFELDLAKVELCAWAERGFKAGSTLFGRIGRRAHLELTLG